MVDNKQKHVAQRRRGEAGEAGWEGGPTTCRRRRYRKKEIKKSEHKPPLNAAQPQRLSHEYATSGQLVHPVDIFTSSKYLTAVFDSSDDVDT